jgi:dGTPase
MKTRADKERLEDETLAPFAQRSSESRGRKHPEPAHPNRTQYERDRARVIHSRAFRRLEYKTQVFLNGTGDHLRTRLTHTMEVASISRTIASSLGLNEPLTEAIALAHDLGHSPVGHSGEELLNELMKDHGGFDHNDQSLRIVEGIEEVYPRFSGLNLSFEVLEGLKKHARFYDPPEPGAERYSSPSLEAQIANLSDEITYYSHDLDDGLDFHLITPEQLGELEVWQHSYEDVRRHFPKLKGQALHRYVIRCIIDREVQDVIATSSEMIEDAGVQSVAEVRQQKKPLIRYSLRLLKANKALRKFLYKNLYYHPRVAAANQRACQLLKNVFEAYLKNPKLLGESTALRVKKDGLPRAVCDYLSGMTDRYLMEEHERLFSPESLTTHARSRLGEHPTWRHE